MKKRGDKRKLDVSLGKYNDWSNDTKYFLTQGSTVKFCRTLPTQYSNNMLSSSVHERNKLCRKNCTVCNLSTLRYKLQCIISSICQCTMGVSVYDSARSAYNYCECVLINNKWVHTKYGNP